MAGGANIGGLSGTTIRQIIYEVEARGATVLTDLQAKLAALNAALDAERAALKSGAIGTDEFEKNTRDLIRAIEELRAKSAAAEIAVNRGGDALLKTHSSAAGAGRSLLEVGRIVQDFQAAGLNGIINNFEGLAQSLGLGAGVAGAVTVLGVAFQTFWPQIQAFLQQAFDSGPVNTYKRAIDVLAERLKTLEDKPIKLQFEQQELDETRRKIDRMTEALKTFQELSERKTKAQSESGKAIREGLTEQLGGGQGFEDLKGELVDTMTTQRSGDNAVLQSLLGQEQQAKAAIAAARARGEDAKNIKGLEKIAQVLADRISQMRGKIDDEVATEIGLIFTDAEAGVESAQKELADLLERHGHADLAKTVRENTASATAVKAVEDAQAKLAEKAGEVVGKAQDEARKAADQAQKQSVGIGKDLLGAGRDVTRDKFREQAADIKEAAQERNREVENLSRQLGPAWDAAIQRLLFGMMQRGMGEEQAHAAIRQVLLNRFAQLEIPAGLRAELADKILGRSQDRLMGAMELAGVNRQFFGTPFGANVRRSIMLDRGSAGGFFRPRRPPQRLTGADAARARDQRIAARNTARAEDLARRRAAVAARKAAAMGRRPGGLSNANAFGLGTAAGQLGMEAFRSLSREAGAGDQAGALQNIQRTNEQAAAESVRQTSILARIERKIGPGYAV